MEIKSGDRFDKRLIERRLRKGEVSREEYEAHLASLQDKAKSMTLVESKVEPVMNGSAEDEDDE